MAVSHRWFIQFSPPSVIFADITRHYEDVHSNWDPYEKVSYPTRGYKSRYPSSDGYRQPSDTGYRRVESSYVGRQPVKPVYEDEPSSVSDVADYVYEGDDDAERTENTGYGSRVAGLSLWLTMLSLAQAQTKPADLDTPPFNTLYKWKEIDFDFPSPSERLDAIASAKYDPSAVLPLGLEVWGNRLFISLPNWRKGIPVTLATLPSDGGVTSPLLKPYPDWNYHNAFRDDNNCTGMTSVFRMSADPCGRLWVLDSGQINSQNNPQQVCPPSIIVFNLTTDTIIHRYEIPSEYVLQNSLFSNIVVDTRLENCSDLHLYIADTWRFGLLVFRHTDETFWRFSHPYFFPDPFSSNYSLHGINFQWTDGIFGLALTPIKQFVNRLLIFHPMSSDSEFFVPTSVLQNPNRANDSAEEFSILGPGRGAKGQSSASAMDRNGVMFYGLVTQDALACWNSNKRYTNSTNAIIAKNTETLVFPNDIKVDQNENQSVWVLSNRLPFYQMNSLSTDDFNFRVLYADTSEAVQGTVCETVSSKHPLLQPFKNIS